MKANNQPRQVYDFLKKNAEIGYCDDCLGKHTRIDRHHVNTITSTLALFKKDFTRRRIPCPHRCSDLEKLVTRTNYPVSANQETRRS